MNIVIEIPSIYREGVKAANLGTHMHGKDAPMGFTFCPYRDGSVEQWNFLAGCVEAYMNKDAFIMGEQ